MFLLVKLRFFFFFEILKTKNNAHLNICKLDEYCFFWNLEILKTAHLDSRQAAGPRGRLGDPGLDFPDRGLVLVGGKQ